MHNPVPPGTCLLSTTVYRRFGRSLHSSQNDPSVSALLSLEIPPKICLPGGHFSNCLPDEDYQVFLDLIADNKRSNLNDPEPRPPLADMNSILTTGERYGFDIYRSGGNSIIVGVAPPGLANFHSWTWCMVGARTDD